MLLRANQLELKDVEYRDSNEEDELPVEWVIVKLNFSPTAPDIGMRVRETRKNDLLQYRMGLDSMIDYVFAKRSICRSLRNLYGKSAGGVCGGCPECRTAGQRYLDCPALSFDESSASNPDYEEVTNVINPVKFPFRIKRQLREIIRQKKDKSVCHLRGFLRRPIKSFLNSI